jgi:hypothetical protein
MLPKLTPKGFSTKRRRDIFKHHLTVPTLWGRKKQLKKKSSLNASEEVVRVFRSST